MPERRSPIEEIPLRLAGQSLDERRLDLVLDRFLMPALAAVVCIAFWLQDLWRAYWDVPPKPWISGLLAFAAFGYAALKISKTWPLLRRMSMAIQGERSVGQGLEQLRVAGYAVYHDVPSEYGNVDHVLVGRSGVFTIETKTWSKPTSRNLEITVKGDEISIDGWHPERDPVRQARIQADGLAKILRKTGKSYPVKPVVVFPGWYVQVDSKPADIWILNDKQLPGFLTNEPARLSAQEIAIATDYLEAFIRIPWRDRGAFDLD